MAHHDQSNRAAIAWVWLAESRILATRLVAEIISSTPSENPAAIEMPTPELHALGDVCARLEDAGIAYMLTGSLAMSYYARPRMTRDIDLVIALDATQAAQLTDTLGAEYHVDADAIAAALRAARPWNIIHLPSLVKIDLIPRKDSLYRRAEFERRRRVELAGVDLWIVSIEDLILSKLDWSRDSRSGQQRADVKLLLEAPLDRSYLKDWAARLGLARLLEEVGNE